MTSAKLYHYEVGSTTLKNIWSDRIESTTLNQPFVSDANGVFAFFADGLYKIVIADSNDVVKYTWDNVLIQDFLNPSFSEGSAISSASTIAVGPESFFHITGSVDINTLTGSIPFVWLCFDGTLSLNYSANLLTPGSVNLGVQAGDVIFLLNDGAGVWRVAGQIANSLLVTRTSTTVKVSDGRTNTVNSPLIITATTTNTPAAGIGTGITLRAQSADETPSDFGAIQFAASDISAGSEDTYLDIFLRFAGAALACCYRFASVSAYKCTVTNSNTADHTYYLPDKSTGIGGGQIYDGATLIGGGSTRSLETFTSATGNLSGIHFYSGDVTLNSAHTLTVPAGKKRLVIVATGTITINGTITASGAGGAGGTSGGGVGNGGNGDPGTDQVGGGGGGNAAANTGGNGGAVLRHGITLQSGGSGQVGNGTAGTQLTASDMGGLLAHPWEAMGGAGGGGSYDTAGGAGGGSIVLVAPAIVLANTAVLNTSGVTPNSANYGAGGGGAGNIYIITRSYTDSGATFTQTGGGTDTGTNSNGGAGAAGVKQINIYN
jgi:hypothetical protein